jgi:hypothetical protein
MNMNAPIAGRLLKSAVVFLMQTYPQPALPARAITHIDYCPSFIPNLQEILPRVPPAMADAVDAAAVPVVPVIIKSRNF